MGQRKFNKPLICSGRDIPVVEAIYRIALRAVILMHRFILIAQKRFVPWPAK